MNTRKEPPPKTVADFFRPYGTPSKLDESAAALEAALQRERDARSEERFIWIFVCTVLFDASIFQDLSWIAVLALLVLELPGLIGLAAICGHERVAILLEKLFNELHVKLAGPKSSN